MSCDHQKLIEYLSQAIPLVVIFTIIVTAVVLIRISKLFKKNGF
jgi:hypothetical protein